MADHFWQTGAMFDKAVGNMIGLGPVACQVRAYRPGAVYGLEARVVEQWLAERREWTVGRGRRRSDPIHGYASGVLLGLCVTRNVT